MQAQGNASTHVTRCCGRQPVQDVAMNCDAMTLPYRDLPAVLKDRIDRKQAILGDRDMRLGEGRVCVTSYMENLGWPELFGFDMNRYFSDPPFAFEMQLRQKIFWLDNALDDGNATLDVAADVGMYFDMTLFGQMIRHTSIGVPEFAPHSLANDPEADIPPFDFHRSGAMPSLIRQYEVFKRISETQFGGAVGVTFPRFERGPLDIFVQLRGYERFLDDCRERPNVVHRWLSHFLEERARFAWERQRFLGETALPPTTFVADDWVNVPFISPNIFKEFVVPAYRRIVQNEGPVSGFHTCGRMERLVPDLLNVFPDVRTLHVSGWNDAGCLDQTVSQEVAFDIAFINTFVLISSPDDQREKLLRLADVGRNRRISVCAQAIVRLLPSYADTLDRMNRFIVLARTLLNANRRY